MRDAKLANNSKSATHTEMPTFIVAFAHGMPRTHTATLAWPKKHNIFDKRYMTLLIRFINMRVTMRDAWWKQSEDRARVVVICAWQRGALCALRRPMYMALVSFTILPLSPLPPLPLNKHTDFCDKCVSITCVAQVAVNTAPEDSRERGSRRESDAKE